MVTEEERRVDEEIRAREKLLTQFPKDLKRRIVEVKAYPNEVVQRIQQIDGVLIVFEEKY